MAESARRTPAEAYAAARQRSAYPMLTDFAATLPFRLDDFQRRGCHALEDGHGVLVCAPTGAGKTVVGEFAVHLALGEGGKCFYTTPIKALSNQKYGDLVERYGEASVGLLTGDTAVNGDAPVVVMTTEVLRNMLYSGSPTLRGLSYVVMDEIHYLADRFRGAVWEEVILHLPDAVRLVGLSATVSNAEEFGEWLVEVRGDTTVVVDEDRPVPLWQHMLAGGRMYDLFVGESGGKARLNPDLVRRTEELANTYTGGSRPPRGRGRSRGGGGRPRSTFRPPSRVKVLQRLDSAGLLPAIVFVFSRAGCAAAVEQCVRSGLCLTSPDEWETIRGIVDRHAENLPADDLTVLGFWEWRDALERGIASHHAGLLPAFKEAVEELFVGGYVKAVFATETLALGINMPARTVVLERLVKYNGESHVDLTPGEYTQLTGRAGRRGIDVEGHAVVLWQPGVDPKQVGGLASTRTYPLRSSFQPGYNMAVNLVHQLGAGAARDLLGQSFAQFQADRSVVSVARTIERNREALDGYAESMRCDLGDFSEYADLRRRLTEREKELAKRDKAASRAEAARSLERLHKGDVIAVPGGRRSGLAVVIDPGMDGDSEPRPLVVTEDRWGGQLTPADFPSPVTALGTVRLPKYVQWRSPKVRRDLASSLRNTGIEAPARAGRRRGGAEPDAETDSLRRALRDHPCHDCPDRESHARWGERYQRLASQTSKLESQVAGATGSLARRFDRIVGLLTERGYLPRGESREVTAQGRRLSRIYSESDLLVAECLATGTWRGLEAEELAAVVSALVFEPRRESPMRPSVPSGAVARAFEDTERVWRELAEAERRHRLPRTREPDAGFAWPVYRWARGQSLRKVLTEEEASGQELSAGDFVRWCRQVIDLLEQVRDVVGGDDGVGAAAAAAVGGIRRGVVAVGTA